MAFGQGGNGFFESIGGGSSSGMVRHRNAATGRTNVRCRGRGEGMVFWFRGPKASLQTKIQENFLSSFIQHLMMLLYTISNCLNELNGMTTILTD